MPTRILIVDAYESHRNVILGFIRNMRPDIEITAYDPEKSGLPGDDFQWGEYSLLVIDSRLGTHSGLDWLRNYKNRTGFPPAIFLSSQNSVDVAVEAMKLGATDFLLKKGIDPKRLRKIFSEILPSAEPILDLMPAMKPLPAHYETQQYAAASTQVLPGSVKPNVRQENPAVDQDEYWDQQTQVLYRPTTPTKGK